MGVIDSPTAFKTAIRIITEGSFSTDTEDNFECSTGISISLIHRIPPHRKTIGEPETLGGKITFI